MVQTVRGALNGLRSEDQSGIGRVVAAAKQ